RGRFRIRRCIIAGLSVPLQECCDLLCAKLVVSILGEKTRGIDTHQSVADLQSCGDLGVPVIAGRYAVFIAETNHVGVMDSLKPCDCFFEVLKEPSEVGVPVTSGVAKEEKIWDGVAR